ncbi:MAG: acyl-CoA/acyl-ACP dehydrogenase [Firmicutes bacterium]|nr:acyl-CoA/acyl-ACP dehydrogenase [Bacillota bacterium]
MTDARIRTEEERAIVQWAATLSDQLSERAKEYDEAGVFVYDQIELLQRAGYGGLTVPKAYGGKGASLYSFLLAQERLAEGDSSAALVMGWSLGITLSLQDTHAWPDALFETFCREAVAGRALVNACGSEPETGSPSRGGRPTTQAIACDGGYQITGHKTWATGSLKLTHIIVTAYIPDLDRVGEFLIRQGAPGLMIEETWDTMSMRGTGSNTLHLNQVFVPAKDALDIIEPGARARRSTDGSGWLLHIPATYLGVANAARRYAIDFAKTYAPNSLGKPIATVPHVRDKIGRIELLRDTARTTLYDVAARYDAASDADRPKMRTDLGLAKVVAMNAALEIVDLAMRVVGGQSLWKSTPLERYYRDVRAGLHNPPMEDAVMAQLASRALE